MKATDLRPGDRIEINSGAMFPVIEAIVIGIDSAFGGYFAVAVDEDGDEHNVSGTSVDESASASSIGWHRVAAAAA